MLLICTASLIAFGAGIDGKWISEIQVGDADGKTYTHTSTISLKSENGLLTGTIVQVSAAPWMKELTGRSIDIRDGNVEGDKFSFKLITENAKGERTAVYEGRVECDELKGTIKYRGIGITNPFNAKRVN